MAKSKIVVSVMVFVACFMGFVTVLCASSNYYTFYDRLKAVNDSSDNATKLVHINNTIDLLNKMSCHDFDNVGIPNFAYNDGCAKRDFYLCMLLYNRGVIYTEMKQPDKAIPDLENSLYIRDVRGNKYPAPTFIASEINLATCHAMKGEFKRAIDILTDTKRLVESQQTSSSAETAAKDNYLSILYRNIASFDQAQSMFKEAEGDLARTKIYGK